MLFEREDWQLFRSVETLGQKAGVSKNRLSMLVAKELVDNALDACGTCIVGELGSYGFFVEDDGGGIDNIETLFSINRPLISTKLIRLPQRGALGNGLRVVTGAVLATNGKLFVSTKGKRYQLIPKYDDGSTIKQYLGEADQLGTRIEVYLGEVTGPVNLTWAKNAIIYAKGDYYKGKTSAFWYTLEAFYELCLASRGVSVLELVSMFDGCTGQKAGLISSDFKGKHANTLTENEARKILNNMRSLSKPVKSDRLGAIGEINGYQYAKTMVNSGVVIPSGKSQFNAELPVVIETWVAISEDEECVFSANVNRTPITGNIGIHHSKNVLQIWSCGLDTAINIGKKPIDIFFNVITPYMPITTDGKEPDFSNINDYLSETIEKAV